MVALPIGSGYEPASVPSARSAVSTTPLAWAGPAGAATGSGAAGRASLKPHDAQNLLFGGFECSHWGQLICPEPPAAGAGVAGASSAAAAAFLALASMRPVIGMPMEVLSSTIGAPPLAAETPCG